MTQLVRTGYLLGTSSRRVLFNSASFALDFTTGFYKNAAGYVRTNLLLRSQEFDNASWSVAGTVTVTPNAVTAPDGTLTADKIMEVAAASTPRIIQSSVTTPGSTYTMSVFAKAAERTQIRMVAEGSGNFAAYFDLATGKLGAVGSMTTASITPLADGWYRCAITYTAAGASSTAYIANAEAGATVASGDAAKGLYLWGAQFEAGAFATSYIPTTTAAASVTTYSSTNPADVGNMTFTRALAAYGEDTAGNLIQFASGVPRITNKGVLIEEGRTNVLLQSTTLANFTALNATNTTDGTLSLTGNLARKVTSQTAAATLFDYNIGGGASAGANTVSVYAKRGSGSTDANTFALRNATTGTTLVSIEVNYDTGVFSYNAGSSGAVVTPMANGWWRISLTSASFSAGDNLRFYAAFQGDAEAAGEYAYLADAQGEGGSFPTSYIPTTSASVTRPADVLRFTSPPQFSTSSFSMAAQFIRGTPSGVNARILSAYSSDSIFFNTSAALNTGVSFDANATSVSSANAFSLNVSATSAAAKNAGTTSIALNGGAVSSGALSASGTDAPMYLGNRSALDRPINGYIQRLAIYPFAASDAQLQSLSSGNFLL